MKLRLAFLVATSILCSLAMGQTGDQSIKSEELVGKIEVINLMNQVNPLVLTKEQIRKLLPPIEKARQKVKEIKKAEADEMKKLETKIDAALKEGYEKGAVPSPDLVKELAATFNAMRIRRDLIAQENAENVYDIFKVTLNAGQLKAAANSLNPKMFNPDFKPEEMKDEDRHLLFVREILLHPATYEMLVKMAK